MKSKAKAIKSKFYFFIAILVLSILDVFVSLFLNRSLGADGVWPTSPEELHAYQVEHELVGPAPAAEEDFKTLFSPPWVFLSPASEERCRILADTYQHLSSQIKYNVEKKEFLFQMRGETWIPWPCSDGQDLIWKKRILSPDLASILGLSYPFQKVSVPVKKTDFDPGRVRDYHLFESLYGHSESSVRSQLETVEFLNQQISFNRNAGAARALALVNSEIMERVKSDPELYKYLEPWLTKRQSLRGSTFNWRPIAGTNRKSVHSYGVAIDLYNESVPGPAYWAWDYAKQEVERARREGRKVSYSEVLKNLKEEEVTNYTPRNAAQVPWGLVTLFEKHGFIWGGKWNHFDVMHFEYRPEFLEYEKCKRINGCL